MSEWKIPENKDPQYEEGYADGLKADRWIPVSERLPEIGQDVLCTLKVDGVNRRVAVCKCKQEVWWYYAIAWMPLPPCYESQESEDKE